MALLYPATIWRRALLAPALAFSASAVEAAEDEPAEAGALAIDAAYTADVWYNLDGGIRRGSAYLDNLDLVATYDADRGLGLDRTTVTVSLLYNNRTTLSDRIVGDLQTVSNIDTNGALRLYEAWVDHDYGRGAIKAGLIDLNSEFDVNETGALFINSSHGIGPDFSQVGENGPGIFPVTALGARASLRLGDKTELKLGLFEGTPGDPGQPRRTVLRVSRDEGALVVGEAIFKPTETTRLSIGVWHHGGSQAAPTSERLRKANGGYALAETRLFDTGSHQLSVFARIGLASGDVYQVGSYQGAGLALGGPMIGIGSEERFGVAVASARNGDAFVEAQRALGTPVNRRETTVELTYRVRLTPWLAIQPDLQYIVNPGTSSHLRNAIAAGVRFEMTTGILE